MIKYLFQHYDLSFLSNFLITFVVAVNLKNNKYVMEFIKVKLKFIFILIYLILKKLI